MQQCHAKELCGTSMLQFPFERPPRLTEARLPAHASLPVIAMTAVEFESAGERANEGCTGPAQDMWQTGQKVACCNGLIEAIVTCRGNDRCHVCEAIGPACTLQDRDMWETGRKILCCSGLIERVEACRGNDWCHMCRQDIQPTRRRRRRREPPPPSRRRRRRRQTAAPTSAPTPWPTSRPPEHPPPPPLPSAPNPRPSTPSPSPFVQPPQPTPQSPQPTPQSPQPAPRPSKDGNQSRMCGSCGNPTRVCNPADIWCKWRQMSPCVFRGNVECWEGNCLCKLSSTCQSSGLLGLWKSCVGEGISDKMFVFPSNSL